MLAGPAPYCLPPMQAAPGGGTGAASRQAGAARRRRVGGRPGRVVGPALAGWLRRKSGPASGWQRGWCVLTGGQLTWFDGKGGTALNCAAAEIGADVFLGKPFNEQELRSVVRNLLSLKSREKEVQKLLRWWQNQMN